MQAAARISQRPAREILTEANRPAPPLATTTHLRVVKAAVELSVPKREHVQLLRFRQITTIGAALPDRILLALPAAVHLREVTTAGLPLVPLLPQAAVIHRVAAVEALHPEVVIREEAAEEAEAVALRPAEVEEGKNKLFKIY